MSRHGRGTNDTPFRRVWGCTPHSLFSLLREKRECAVHGGREKRDAFPCGSASHSSQLRSKPAAWTQGLQLLCPRFAHTRPVTEPPSPPAAAAPRPWGAIFRAFDLHRPCAKRGQRSKSLRPRSVDRRTADEWRKPRRAPWRLSFVFGPCTARFYFLWQDRENRNGGCIPSTGEACAFVPRPWRDTPVPPQGRTPRPPAGAIPEKVRRTSL